MRYTLLVGASSPSKIGQVNKAIERGMRRRYSDDLAMAMREFLEKCVGATATITKVTVEASGRFIVETLKPLTDFAEVIGNMLRSQFHTNAKIEIECHPR